MKSKKSSRAKRASASSAPIESFGGITLAQAARVLEVVDAGLCSGKGVPEPGKMCVEAAVTFALGEPFSDEPSCVAPAVRTFKIALNDCTWSSNKARAEGMRRIAIAQLGSRGIDEVAFAKALAEQTIRMVVPAALRAVAGMNGIAASDVTALQSAADRCEKEGTEDAARAASDASYAASAASAASYAASAARAASYAASAASYAASAASDASYAASAARAASYAASAASDASYAASDGILMIAAEAGVQALRMIGAAGVHLLDKLIP